MANSYVFYANKNGRPVGLPGFVGPKGPQGLQGEQGLQGLQGDPGVFIGAEEDMPEGTRVRFDPDGSPDIAAVINDSNISEDETWSSDKINSVIGSLLTTINNLTTTVNSLTTLADRSSEVVYVAPGTPLKCQLHKIGHTASLRILTDSMNFTAGQSTYIARVPIDCKPAEGYYYAFATTSNYRDSCEDCIFMIMVNDSGEVYATAIKAMTSTRCNINLTYICAQ